MTLDAAPRCVAEWSDLAPADRIGTHRCVLALLSRAAKPPKWQEAPLLAAINHVVDETLKPHVPDPPAQDVARVQPRPRHEANGSSMHAARLLFSLDSLLARWLRELPLADEPAIMGERLEAPPPTTGFSDTEDPTRCLIDLLGQLCERLLRDYPDDRLICHAFLTFYKRVACVHRTFAVGHICLPSFAAAQRCLLLPCPIVTSNLCNLLSGYRKEIEALKRVSSRIHSPPQPPNDPPPSTPQRPPSALPSAPPRTPRAPRLPSFPTHSPATMDAGRETATPQLTPSATAGTL